MPAPLTPIQSRREAPKAARTPRGGIRIGFLGGGLVAGAWIAGLLVAWQRSEQRGDAFTMTPMFGGRPIAPRNSDGISSPGFALRLDGEHPARGTIRAGSDASSPSLKAALHLAVEGIDFTDKASAITQLADLRPAELDSAVEALRLRLTENPADLQAALELCDLLEPYQQWLDAWVGISHAPGRFIDPEELNAFNAPSHLGALRVAGRYLSAAAMVDAVIGDPEQAAARSAALLRLARQAGEDGWYLSSLVGTAMLRNADSALIAAASVSTFSDQARAELLAARTAFAETDPFRLRANLLNDVTGLRNALLQSSTELASPESARAFFTEALNLQTTQADQRRLEQTIEALYARGALSENLERELDGYRRYMEQSVRAMDSENVSAELERIDEQLRAGAFGTLVFGIAPAIEKTIEIEQFGLCVLDRLDAALAEATEHDPEN